MPTPSLTDPAAWPSALAGVRAQLGTPLNIHRMLANRPEMLAAWWPFRNFVVHDSCLATRAKEIVILRVAHLARGDYEWRHHVRLAMEAGLSEAEVARIQAGPEAEGWPDAERALVEAVDQCFDRHGLSEPVIDSLTSHFGPNAAYDVLATVGMYNMLALMTNSFQVPMDAVGPSFSSETREPG